MDISIIIPVFNKIEVIKHCIELNIRHCSKPRNWIIIDNNSDIDTKNGLLDLQKYANSVGHTFFIHTEKENTGVARAWNKGLSMVNTKYVCILNNDCVMMPNWDCEMMEKSEYHHLGISTPLVLESEMFNVNYNLNSFLNGRKNWKYLSKKNAHKIRLGVFTGVVFFGEKSIFDKIGPFDENFWLSLEEYDYLLRARHLSIETGTIGFVTAFHLAGITRKEMKTDGGTANQRYFEQKWGWNFEKTEQKFPNKQIRSMQRWLFRHFQILSSINFSFPLQRN